MKGIILAGGSGSRLYPITHGVSKQILPIYDKPMIYYPLSVLMLAGIREILIITTPNDLINFQRLLGNGSDFGINIQYKIQEKPNGIAESFIIGEEFIDNDPVTLILGDNIFYGHGLRSKLINAAELNKGATIFGYQVKDPERFGVVDFSSSGEVNSIEEKPQNPLSNYAVTGLYIYDNDVCRIAKSIKPSPRGELEISCVNNEYIKNKNINFVGLGRGFTWLDTGTHSSLLEAGMFVETIEKMQGYKIACLEEIGYNNGWLSLKDLRNLKILNYKNDYSQYIKSIIEDDR